LRAIKTPTANPGKKPADGIKFIILNLKK